MYDIKKMNIWKPEKSKDSGFSEYLNTDVADLSLSVRSYNCLKRAGCNTVRDIMVLLEEDGDGLKKVRNLGQKSADEIMKKLAEQEKYYSSGAVGSDGKESQKRPTTRVTIRPARNIWDKDISAFGISSAAIQHLRSHGINRIQDLYENNLGKDPGWFAVRELFELVARGIA